jgi:excisionase family DNA binding protein
MTALQGVPTNGAGNAPELSPEPSSDLTLTERLRALASLLPPGATVSLDKAALVALCASERHDRAPGDTGGDLTTTEVAQQIGLSKNRVRALIAEGKLAAYRGCGRWRVTQAALAAFRQSAVPALIITPSDRADRVDLARWRRAIHRKDKD